MPRAGLDLSRLSVKPGIHGSSALLARGQRSASALVTVRSLGTGSSSPPSRSGTFRAHDDTICPEPMRNSEISAAGQTACAVRSPWSERPLHRTRPTGRLAVSRDSRSFGRAVAQANSDCFGRLEAPGPAAGHVCFGRPEASG